jgi:hypothetical protein
MCDFVRQKVGVNIALALLDRLSVGYCFGDRPLLLEAG